MREEWCHAAATSEDVGPWVLGRGSLEEDVARRVAAERVRQQDMSGGKWKGGECGGKWDRNGGLKRGKRRRGYLAGLAWPFRPKDVVKCRRKDPSRRGQ